MWLGRNREGRGGVPSMRMDGWMAPDLRNEENMKQKKMVLVAWFLLFAIAEIVVIALVS